MPVVIFWHGGSWSSGSKEQYIYLGMAIAKMDCVAVIIDYRKYPEIKFPAFTNDAIEALSWIYRNINQYGGNPTKLFTMGHSAGAHTAAMVTYYPEYLKSAGVPPSAIKGFIGVSGPYDFYPRRSLHAIFPITDPKQPWRIGPGILKTTTPALLLHGYFDPIVRTKYSKLFAQQLRRAGAQVWLKHYLPFEHFLIIAAYMPLLRLLPGPWRNTKRFIKQYK